jgi:hypothetical protein
MRNYKALPAVKLAGRFLPIASGLYRRCPNRQRAEIRGAFERREACGLGNPRYGRFGNLRYNNGQSDGFFKGQCQDAPRNQKTQSFNLSTTCHSGLIRGSQLRDGRLPKWPTGADCKSAGLRLLWFESRTYHHLISQGKQRF